MAKVDFGLGEQEIRCTYRTLSYYEQEFCNDPCPNVTGDLIADALGKITVDENSFGLGYGYDGQLNSITIDFTNNDWNVHKRALWAMLRTAAEIDRIHGKDVERVPSYKEWDKSLIECEPDLREVSDAISGEILRGLFRSGAAASR